MISPSYYQNIENFENLTLNHQRVFKHRLKKKVKEIKEDAKFLKKYSDEIRKISK